MRYQFVVSSNNINGFVDLDELIDLTYQKVIEYIFIQKVDNSYDIVYSDVDTPITDRRLYVIHDELVSFKKALLLNKIDDYYMLYSYSSDTYLLNKAIVDEANLNSTETSIEVINTLEKLNLLFKELKIDKLGSGIYVKNNRGYKELPMLSVIDVLMSKIQSTIDISKDISTGGN